MTIALVYLKLKLKSIFSFQCWGVNTALDTWMPLGSGTMDSIARLQMRARTCFAVEMNITNTAVQRRTKSYNQKSRSK